MIENIVYTALITVVVIIVLHIGVFWVSRVIQPPKPRVVYMPAPQQYNTLPPAPVAPPPPPPPAPVAPPEIKLPTYDSPPAKPVPPSLPPPIETRG